MGGWVGWVEEEKAVRMSCCGVCMGGWVGGWVGWVEEEKAVRMSCCGVCMGGWVGGWVGGLGWGEGKKGFWD